MMTSKFLVASLLVVGLTSEIQAGSKLATFDEVQKRSGSPGIRLLDVRPLAEYEKAHAPGAVWVDSKAAQAIASKPGAFEDRNAWQKWVAPLGLGKETEVLIFDGARQLDASRLWWMLSYLGVENVGLIDGNFPLWIQQGRPTTAEAPKVEPGTFIVTFRSSLLATREEVLTALKSGRETIVDARSTEEYSGERKMSSRGGHIPAACRLEWSDLVDQDGRFLEESALRARLNELGVKPDAPVITHCQGGGRASVDAFAIGRLGYTTRNFYQGWSDWGNAATTPVIEGADPGKRP